MCCVRLYIPLLPFLTKWWWCLACVLQPSTHRQQPATGLLPRPPPDGGIGRGVLFLFCLFKCLEFFDMYSKKEIKVKMGPGTGALIAYICVLLFPSRKWILMFGFFATTDMQTPPPP